MNRPDWLSPDLTKAFFALERKTSPRLEAALRTDTGLDLIAATVAVRRIAANTVYRSTNTVVETLGLPSRRQLHTLQRSLDAAASRDT